MDACIARVREVAGLDEDVVLPPLPLVAPRRDVVILTKNDLASAGDALGASTSLDVERISPRSDGRPAASARAPKRASRAPLFFCALVAVAFGGAAFLESPAGKAPSVVRVTSAVRAHASHAGHAVAAVVGRARP